MRRRRLSALCAALALCAAAHSLRAADFAAARPGYEFQFPRDHGSHPAFRTEWWYFTGHLSTDDREHVGFELTFFRVGVARDQRRAPQSVWRLQDLALAHFAVTDTGRRRFRYYEKLNRSTPFTASARVGSLNVFNEGWSAAMGGDGSIRLIAAAGGDAIDLTLRAVKPPAVHGVNGVSQKAVGEEYASHYYSLTRLEVSGTVTLAGQRSNCRGSAWMDHEFGSSTLREEQQGWDWFSVQLDDGSELMLYQIRRSDGRPDVTSSGSYITADGTMIHLRGDQFRITPQSRWRSKASGAVYPMGWNIDVLPLRLRLTVEPLLESQELITRSSTQIVYWEGAVTITGNASGSPVRGKGYVEMTGYDRPFGKLR